MGVVTLDAVVIGGGPAEAGGRHLAGPLPADRAGAGQRRVPHRWAEASHGYLGRDPVAPAELRAAPGPNWPPTRPPRSAPPRWSRWPPTAWRFEVATDSPRPDELADHLELGEEEVLEALTEMTSRWEVSLDQPTGEDTDACLGDLVAAPGAREEPEDLLALPDLVVELPELERQVIMLRFFQPWTSTRSRLGSATPRCRCLACSAALWPACGPSW